MPRYHFNIYDGVTALDEEGMQLVDIEKAQLEGVRLAGDLLRSAPNKVRLGEEWRVEVTDGRGMVLFRIDVMLTASSAVG